MKRSLALTLVIFAAVGCPSSPGTTPRVKSNALAGRSLEDLLALHVDDQARVDRDALREGLRERLNDLPTSRLLKLQVDVARQKICIDYVYPLLRDLVEGADVIVHGRVEKLQHNPEDLIKNILDRELDLIRATVHVQVLGQYPATPTLQRITCSGRVGWENIHFVEEGGEYFFVLWQSDAGYTGAGPTTVFRVRPDGVQRVIGFGPALSVEETWEIVRIQYRLTRGNGKLPQPTLDRWLAKLRSDDLTECTAALHLLNGIPGAQLDTHVLVDAVERHYRLLREGSRGRLSVSSKGTMEFCLFARTVFETLAATPEPDGVGRMYNLYLEDLANYAVSAFDGFEFNELVVRLVASLPGAERRKRLEHLFSTEEHGEYGNLSKRIVLIRSPGTVIKLLANVPGEDIDSLLLDMLDDPERFRLRNTTDLGAVWLALAQRGKIEIRPMLERLVVERKAEGADRRQGYDGLLQYARDALKALSRFLPDEEALPLLMTQYKAGDKGAIYEFSKRVAPGSNVAVDLLQDAKMTDVAFIIAEKTPHPLFTPKLEAALAEKVTPDLVLALDACGGREKAVKAALVALRKSPKGIDPASLHGELKNRVQFVKYLGAAGDRAAVAVIEPLTQDKGLQEYRDVVDAAWKDRSPRRRYRQIACLQQAAILALARLGDEGSIPALKDTYATGDEETRFVAAWALYYLGDDTGVELVRAYAERRETRVPVLWQDDRSSRSGLSQALLYLPSPRLDRVFLQRLRRGLYYPDHYLVGGLGRDNERELLPLLAEHLDSRQDMTREIANDGLKGLTGKDFGVNPKVSPRFQQNAVEQWRSYVDSYLADKYGP